MDDPRDRPIPGLDALYADREPPPSHEERAVQLFRTTAAEWRLDGHAQRTRATSRDSGRRMPAPFRIAAAVLLFFAGFATARLLVRTPASDSPASRDTAAPANEAGARRYMLLLWARPDFAADVPPARLVHEYTEWARATASAGVAISGHELGAERIIVRDDVATARNLAGVRVGGFFIVAAPDAAAARRIAEGHPHIGYGGWIEIAEVL